MEHGHRLNNFHYTVIPRDIGISDENISHMLWEINDVGSSNIFVDISDSPTLHVHANIANVD